MKHRLLIVAIVLGLVGPASLAAAEEALQLGVVLKGVENMYSSPSDSVDVVSQATVGTPIRIHKTDKKEGLKPWYLIETPDTYQGWMPGSSLRILAPGEKPYGQAGRVFEVTSLFANIYDVQDVTERKPRLTASIGAVLEVSGEAGNRWCPVLLPDGIRAWVQRGDGEIRDAGWKRPRLAPAAMAALSKRFLGLPYYWGGTTPYGLDCSGFVQLVYRLSGIDILRDADIQMEKSGLQEVPAGQEKVGDLVFFGNARGQITHVGMMVGPGEFINATTWIRPIVQVSRLDEPHWKTIYKGARRARQ